MSAKAAATQEAARGRETAQPGRRVRTGGKRLSFVVPKMPRPVRALWQGASEEQRARAHKTAVAVLSTWLGKARREEAARELGLSGIRFWQLSQQALAGLVAGCLRQPRYRGRGRQETEEEGTGVLRKKIVHLERELAAAERLIGLLKDLPGRRERVSAERGRGRRQEPSEKEGPADDAGAAARGRSDALGTEGQ